MFGQGFNYGFLGKPPCFTDTTDIFKDNSGVALYTLDYDASDSGNATGKFSEAAVFNGSSSKITLPSSGTTPIDLSTENWTVSLWFKQNARAATTIFSKWGSGTANVAFIISVLSSDNTKLYIGQKSTSGATTSTIPSQSFDINVWNHLVVTRSSTQTIVYLNNIKEEFSTTNNVQQSASTPFIIGAQYGTGGGTGFFNGSIDQVRLFNRTISTLEAATLYNETKNTTNTLQTLGDTSCIATYTLDGSSTDLSGNYNGTDTNILYKYDGTPTNVDFGVGGKSLYGARFNGSNSAIIVPNNILASNNHSISTWFYLNDTSGIQTLIEFDYGNRIIFRVASTDSNWAYIGSSGYFNHGISFSAGQWYHLAITFSAGNPFKIYVNGNLSYTGGNTNLYLRTVDNIIGAGNSSGANGVDGTIDQVRLFNKALSAAEISKLYGNGAGEIACEYTSTTDNIAFPITNTAYYKLDNDSKDSARSTGKFNEGAIFNGSSSKIDIDNIIPTNLNTSLSLWVKSPEMDLNNTTIRTVFYNRNPYFIIYRYAGNWLFVIKNSSSTNTTVSYPVSNFNNNQWYHFAATCDGLSGTMSFYVNGVSVGTTTAPSSILNVASSAFIGSGANAQYFNGSIDQVRIYDTALSSTDVSNLYAETVSTTGTLSFPSGQTAIATYQLDGNSNDLSGNYNGTDTNITYAYDGTESNIEYRFGKFGQAAVFDGYNSIIEASNVSGLNNATAVSASLWFNWDDSASVSNYGHIINIGTGTLVNGDFFGLAVGDDGASYNRVLYGYFPEGSDSTGQTVTDNAWHHAVIVYEGTSVKYYYDGSLIATHTKTSLSLPSSGNHITIGEYAYNGSHHFKGQIDQVRIFSTALTSAQVSQLYNEKPETDTSNFKTVLYQGNGSSQYISNVGFEPDLVWVKSRGVATSNNLFDSIRGNKRLVSNVTSAQVNLIPYEPFGLPSFEENGFYIGDNYNGDYGLNGNPSGTYGSSSGYVAWCWKGGGDAVSNTQGTNITSQVSANTAAGFSIVKWTGDANASSTIGHGLSPNSESMLVIMKDLDSSNDWMVMTNDLWASPTAYYLKLNLSAGVNTGTGTPYLVNNTVFKNTNRNINGNDYIAYCFHSVSGISSIGSYTGTGAAGHTIVTGFEPAFLMIKASSASASWYMFDDKRLTSPYSDQLIANSAGAEFTGTYVVLNSNGFTLNTTASDLNTSGVTFIYMAFK